MNTKAYTLIEVLIALAVFAIIAVLTSSALQQTLGINQRLQTHMNEWERFALTIDHINQHITQMVPRGVRGNDGVPIPSFVGQKDYIEFTRGGYINPQGEKRQSSLARIALLCKNGKLIERRWPVLDSINRKQYQDDILLDNLSRCQFDFLSQQMEWLTPWRANTNTGKRQNTAMEMLLLPKAIRLELDWRNQGKSQFIFINPIGNYAG